jgi:hypothetical protein
MTGATRVKPHDYLAGKPVPLEELEKRFLRFFGADCPIQNVQLLKACLPAPALVQQEHQNVKTPAGPQVAGQWLGTAFKGKRHVEDGFHPGVSHGTTSENRGGTPRASGRLSPKKW